MKKAAFYMSVTYDATPIGWQSYALDPVDIINAWVLITGPGFVLAEARLVNKPYSLPVTVSCLLFTLTVTHTKIIFDSYFGDFINHDNNMQVKHDSTHQITMYHNFQALHCMLQCSHNSHTISSILMVYD